VTVPELSLLNLPQQKPGFYDFISCWILRKNQKTIVVDPGPASTIPLLLEEIGAGEIDYVFLTHIHIDHAGGIGHLLKAHPQAKVIASPRAHKHLIDPSKLIEGSRKTLGSIVNLYGEIFPIDAKQISESMEVCGFKMIETPGHASHHISFVDEKYCFCGEALGVIYPKVPDYLRPATPPKFIPEIYKASIEKLAAFQDRTFCFGHFGQFINETNPCSKARKQIDLWLEVIKASMEEKRMLSLEDIKRTLLALDRNFSLFRKLPKDIQRREDSFVSNAIKGIAQHLINAN